MKKYKDSQKYALEEKRLASVWYNKTGQVKTAEEIIIYFRPLFPFYTPNNIRKPEGVCFQRVLKGNIDLNWVHHIFLRVSSEADLGLLQQP